MRSRGTPPVKSETVFDRRGSSTSQSSAPARRAGDRRGASSKDSSASDAPAGDSRTEAPLEQSASRKRRATRDGREALVVYMPADCIKALKIAAVEQDTSASAIVTNLVVAWLRSHGQRG